MIGYRFLFPAGEEMTEASGFYDAASNGLGEDFLDDVQQAIDTVCEYPQAGEVIADDLRRVLLHRFPFSVIYSVERRFWSSRSRIMRGVQAIGTLALTAKAKPCS